MTKMGSESTSRLIASYYPLLIAGILVIASLDGRIVHRRMFRWVGLIAMLSAIPLVVACPARPLFPVQIVSKIMVKSHIPAWLLTRYNNVYSVYASRADPFEELTASIPSGSALEAFWNEEGYRAHTAGLDRENKSSGNSLRGRGPGCLGKPLSYGPCLSDGKMVGFSRG